MSLSTKLRCYCPCLPSIHGLPPSKQQQLSALCNLQYKIMCANWLPIGTLSENFCFGMCKPHLQHMQHPFSAMLVFVFQLYFCLQLLYLSNHSFKPYTSAVFILLLYWKVILLSMYVLLSNVHGCVVTSRGRRKFQKHHIFRVGFSCSQSPRIILDDVSDSSLLGCWLGWPNPDWTADQTQLH